MLRQRRRRRANIASTSGIGWKFRVWLLFTGVTSQTAVQQSNSIADLLGHYGFSLF